MLSLAAPKGQNNDITMGNSAHSEQALLLLGELMRPSLARLKLYRVPCAARYLQRILLQLRCPITGPPIHDRSQVCQRKPCRSPFLHRTDDGLV